MSRPVIRCSRSSEALQPGLLPPATASQRRRHSAAVQTPVAAQHSIYLQSEARGSQANRKRETNLRVGYSGCTRCR